MKIVIALLTLVGASASAQETTVEKITAPVQLKQEIHSFVKPAKNSFTYIRMSAAPVQGVGAVPGIGIGYRLASGSSAMDLSANMGVSHQKHGSNAVSYTLPKANYLYYFTPTEDNSLYVGGGLAWGGIHTEVYDRQASIHTDLYDDEEDDYDHFSQRTDFDGIIANAAVGYELQRSKSFRSFVQLDVSQPTLAVSQRHAFPSPSAELSIGIGF